MRANIKMMITNARPTDKTRTTIVPRRDEESMVIAVQPVGKDDVSKSSNGGEEGPRSSSSLFLPVGEGKHGPLRKKGGKFSAGMERGGDAKGLVYSRYMSHKETMKFYGNVRLRPERTYQADYGDAVTDGRTVR